MFLKIVGYCFVLVFEKNNWLKNLVINGFENSFFIVGFFYCKMKLFIVDNKLDGVFVILLIWKSISFIFD